MGSSAIYSAGRNLLSLKSNTPDKMPRLYSSNLSILDLNRASSRNNNTKPFMYLTLYLQDFTCFPVFPVSEFEQVMHLVWC